VFEGLVPNKRPTDRKKKKKKGRNCCRDCTPIREGKEKRRPRGLDNFDPRDVSGERRIKKRYVLSRIGGFAARRPGKRKGICIPPQCKGGDTRGKRKNCCLRL